MNENRKRGTSNNKILTAIAIASLFIGSSKIMAIETYSENSFGVTEQMQAQTARGIVVDQNGEPIIGASILEKGTTNGVTTDLYGKFSLNVKRGATLVISYIGYKTQEAKADANMKITLTEDSELLDEVSCCRLRCTEKETCHRRHCTSERRRHSQAEHCGCPGRFAEPVTGCQHHAKQRLPGFGL